MDTTEHLDTLIFENDEDHFPALSTRRLADILAEQPDIEVVTGEPAPAVFATAKTWADIVRDPAIVCIVYDDDENALQSTWTSACAARPTRWRRRMTAKALEALAQIAFTNRITVLR
jgi:hypothetical protein